MTWNPLLHPRGRDGKFIDIGSLIRFIAGGQEQSGTVLRINPDSGSLLVHTGNGTTDVDPDNVTEVVEQKGRIEQPLLIQGNTKNRADELTQVRLVFEQLNTMFAEEPDKRAIATAAETWPDEVWDQVAAAAHAPPLTDEQKDMVKAALVLAASKAPVVAVAWKSKVQYAWNALLHPRGRDGRFIDKGDHVDLFANEHSKTAVIRGKVTKIGKDSADIQVESSSLPKVPPGTQLVDVPSNMMAQSHKFHAKLHPSRPPAPPGTLRPGESYTDLSPGELGMKIGGSLDKNLTKTERGLVITAERKKLHDEILDKLFADKEVPTDPQFIMLGGGVASGKTTVLENGESITYDPATTVNIAADKLQESFPEYQKMLKAEDLRAASYVHEEAVFLAARAERRALREGLSIVSDSTGDGQLWRSIDRLRLAKDRGYTTKGVYVTIPTPTAISRAKTRAKVTGRMVPETMIRRSHEAVSDIFPKINGDFDDIELWDNTGDVPVLIGSKHGDEEFDIQQPELWTQFLDKAPQRSRTERTPGQSSTYWRESVKVPNADKLDDLSGDIRFRRGVSQEGRDINGIPLHEDPNFEPQSIPDVDVGEPPVPPDPRRMRQSAGVIIKEPDGRIWIYEPKNHFGGYEHTFSKGGVELGDTMQQAALREAFEEMGLKAKITGFLYDYKGSTTMTRMYTGERIGGAPWIHDQESHNVKLVSPETARKLLNTERDQLILADLTGNTSVSGARSVTGPTALARLIVDGGFVMTPQGTPQPASNYKPLDPEERLHTDLNTLKTNPSTFEQWRDAHLDVLMQPGYYIGGSMDPATDEIDFEIIQEATEAGAPTMIAAAGEELHYMLFGPDTPLEGILTALGSDGEELTVDQLSQMTAEINLGVPKEESKVYQPAYEDLWNLLKAEVEEAKLLGLVVDVPYDSLPTNQGVDLYGDEEAVQ